MPVRRVADKYGEAITLIDIDGNFLGLPPDLPNLSLDNQELQFRSLGSWITRNDDIFICAYPRSGTHWTWEIVSMLINGKAERVQNVKERFHFDFLPQKYFDSMQSPRILNSHLRFNQLPTDLLNKKCKIIFVQRNPKDVAVSFYNHHKNAVVYDYDGKWENYLHRFLQGLVDFGSWFDYTMDWEKVLEERRDIPIHTIHYEDMIKNRLEETKKLAKFLHVQEDLQLFKDVSELCRFDKMKVDKDAIEATYLWKNGVPGMYRKGQIVSVEGSLHDLRHPTPLGDRLSIDHGFTINYCVGEENKMKLIAKIEHPPTGRWMEVHSTEPCLQSYYSHELRDIKGKGGNVYKRYCAFCMEAMHYPDSINHKNFPDNVLRPGKTYHQITSYKFGVSH